MKHARTQPGFTLLELLLVIGILGVITTVILSSHSRFGGEIILRSLAYDMTLSIRQAQTYGISVKSNVGTNQFAYGHGIHIAMANPRNYILFADSYELVGGSSVLANSDGSDGMYKDEREQITSYTLGGGYSIKELCVSNVSGETCYDPGSSAVLDVTFVRPEPDAYILLSDGSTPKLYSSASITLLSPRGYERTITISVTGQVSIQ